MLKSKLLRRKYPENLIDSAINKARTIDRRALLESKNKQNDKNIVPFCVTYHPNLVRISKIIKINSAILAENPLTTHILNNRLLTAFRRGDSLRNILVRSDIRKIEKKKKGAYPCKNKCKICKYIQPSLSVKNRDGSYEFKINSYLDCNTISLVYLISCNLCSIQYIGQTGNSLKERMYGHLNDIANHNEYKPVSAHFSSNNHSVNNVTITPLLRTPHNINERLRYEEALMIYFRTRQPF